MYLAVIKVEPCDDDTQRVQFSNAEFGLLDAKPRLGFGVFRKLRDETEFRKARVSFDTVTWHHGIDLDPDFVYRHCIKRGTDPVSR